MEGQARALERDWKNALRMRGSVLACFFVLFYFDGHVLFPFTCVLAPPPHGLLGQRPHVPHAVVKKIENPTRQGHLFFVWLQRKQ